MSELVKGLITLDYSEEAYKFTLTVPKKPIISHEKSWAIYGTIQRSSMPYPQVLRAMADMLEEAGLNE